MPDNYRTSSSGPTKNVFSPEVMGRLRELQAVWLVQVKEEAALDEANHFTDSDWTMLNAALTQLAEALGVQKPWLLLSDVIEARQKRIASCVEQLRSDRAKGHRDA